MISIIIKEKTITLNTKNAYGSAILFRSNVLTLKYKPTKECDRPVKRHKIAIRCKLEHFNIPTLYYISR